MYTVERGTGCCVYARMRIALPAANMHSWARRCMARTGRIRQQTARLHRSNCAHPYQSRDQRLARRLRFKSTRHVLRRQAVYRKPQAMTVSTYRTLPVPATQSTAANNSSQIQADLSWPVQSKHAVTAPGTHCKKQQQQKTGTTSARNLRCSCSDRNSVRINHGIPLIGFCKCRARFLLRCAWMESLRDGTILARGCGLCGTSIS
eukprot:SAG31_NODE_545_length_14238_cov_15.518849_13_plen_205_part_00